MKRGHLLAFADDIALMTNSKSELEEMVREMEALGTCHNLRLNKKKSIVITSQHEQVIEGIPCTSSAKYLGVPMGVQLQQTRDQCRASIERNLDIMRWKLRNVDVDIKEILLCVLARSILIYMATPLVGADIWGRKDVERLEVMLYRKVHGITTEVANTSLMNIACGIRPAWDIIQPLVKRANL